MVMLQMELAPEMYKRLEKVAKQRGYSALPDYLAELFDEVTEDELQSAESLIEELKQSLLEIKRGDVLTLEEFYKAMESDD